MLGICKIWKFPYVTQTWMHLSNSADEAIKTALPFCAHILEKFD